MTDSATPQEPAAGPAPATTGPTAGFPLPATPAAPAAGFPLPAPPAAAPAPLGVSAVTGSAEDGDAWAAPAVPPETPEERAARRSRARHAALRWGAAVLVFATAGAGTAFAVTRPERTDIPGLRTAGDGRYTFPALVLPPLPSGRPAPGGPDSRSRHAADLRHLLLPAPKEAGGSLAPVVFPSPTAPAPTAPAGGTDPTADPTAGSASPGAASPGGPASTSAGGPAAPVSPVADWVRCEDAAAEQKVPAELSLLLVENACRASTVREWTAADGTRTQIRLLQFASSYEAWEVYTGLRSKGVLKDLVDAKAAGTRDWDVVPRVELSARESTATGAGGDATGRMAYLSAGDVVGVVVMGNPKGVPAAAFRQVVTLQSDLLS
ncbi:hypothetical protein ACWGB8_29075 [Kitasatospora sp. NPDC054939]